MSLSEKVSELVESFGRTPIVGGRFADVSLKVRTCGGLFEVSGTYIGDNDFWASPTTSSIFFVGDAEDMRSGLDHVCVMFDLLGKSPLLRRLARGASNGAGDDVHFFTRCDWHFDLCLRGMGEKRRLLISAAAEDVSDGGVRFDMAAVYDLFRGLFPKEDLNEESCIMLAQALSQCKADPWLFCTRVVTGRPEAKVSRDKL